MFAAKIFDEDVPSNLPHTLIRMIRSCMNTKLEMLPTAEAMLQVSLKWYLAGFFVSGDVGFYDYEGVVGSLHLLRMAPEKLELADDRPATCVCRTHKALQDVMTVSQCLQGLETIQQAYTCQPEAKILSGSNSSADSPSNSDLIQKLSIVPI